jgi:prepilin-type N-terminal cleavage/methylation domain-containing protein
MRDSEQIQKTDKGFTLVEVLVSITLFLLAMTVVTQLFVFASRAQRKILARSQMIGEISYNLEHISRGLRMAKKSEDSSCLSAPNVNFEKNSQKINGKNPIGNALIFQNRNAAGGFDCVKLYLFHPDDYPAGKTALMEYRDNGKKYALPLTSPDINVLAFSVAQDTASGGWGQNDDLQPRVTIYIKAQDKEGGIFETQTTISQRDLDVVESF